MRWYRSAHDMYRIFVNICALRVRVWLNCWGFIVKASNIDYNIYTGNRIGRVSYQWLTFEHLQYFSSLQDKLSTLRLMLSQYYNDFGRFPRFFFVTAWGLSVTSETLPGSQTIWYILLLINWYFAMNKELGSMKVFFY